MVVKKARAVILGVLIVVLICGFTLNGGIVGPGTDILGQIRLFMEVMNIVRSYYVDEVSTPKLVNGAIRGMLNELDPHTVYIPADEVRELN